jgi:steroid delta-isomerase-like uncharacterized protein
MPSQVETDTITLAKEIYNLISKNDLTRLPSLYADNAVLITVPWNSTARGRNGIIDYVRNFKTAFPDLKLNITHQISEDDFVVTEYVARGTHKGVLSTPMGDVSPTNRNIEVPVCEVVQFKNGLMATCRQYWDTGTFMRQLGLAS